MPRSGLKTREQLLDAGIAVAERHGLAGLSVNRVVDKAGVAKGTFYVHFTDRQAFVDAIHQRFYEGVQDRMAHALEPLEQGAERLVRAADAYLDACLADRAIKALLLEARAEGTLTARMADRQQAFATVAEPSFRAMGWRDAGVAARLFVAQVSEAALLELDAGRKVPAVRRAIRRFVASYERG